MPLIDVTYDGTVGEEVLHRLGELYAPPPPAPEYVSAFSVPLGGHKPLLMPLPYAFPVDAGNFRILVGLEQEFPWHQQLAAGDPFTLSFTVAEGQLQHAAAQWDAERAPFPDNAR